MSVFEFRMSENNSNQFVSMLHLTECFVALDSG